MRSAQGLPVNMIVFVALGLIALVVTAAFFITGMSGAGQQVKTVEEFQAYCNSLCGQMVTAAFGIKDIQTLNNIAISRKYQGSGCALKFGCCRVTLSTGESFCAEGNCAADSECDMQLVDPSQFSEGDPVPGHPGYYFQSAFWFNPSLTKWLVAHFRCSTDLDPIPDKCVIESFLVGNTPCEEFCGEYGLLRGVMYITNNLNEVGESEAMPGTAEICRCYS